MSSAARGSDAWREYVRQECARFYAHCDGETYIWSNTPAAERLSGKLGRGEGGNAAELAAFTGPWHVVRKHVTHEFRQWVEEYEGTDRLTYSQHREQVAAARREVDYIESAEHTLGQLAELRRLTLERDALILQAARRGAAKTAIAASVGLSRQQVHAIISAADAAAFEVWETELTPVAVWDGEPF